MDRFSFPFFVFSLLISSVAGCDRCVHQSKAGYYGSSAISTGACGYGPLAMQLSGGYVVAAASTLFREGVGCGACYQVRCKDTALCSTGGVKVVLTDLHKGTGMDMVLSSQAFSAMAKPGAAPRLVQRGIVDVEYKRIPCVYPNHSLSLRVEEHSTKPHYVALKVLYQGGQTDILAIDIATVNTSNWSGVRHDYGAVWGAGQVPQGALKLRLTVVSGYGRKLISTDNQVLPADWNNGAVYDTGIQITDIAQETCNPCDSSTWF